jgi:hypothetical protein
MEPVNYEVRSGKWRKGRSLGSSKDHQEALRESVAYQYHTIASRSSTVEFPATAAQKQNNLLTVLRDQYHAHQPNIVEPKPSTIEVLVPKGTPTHGEREITKNIRGRQISIRVPQHKKAGDRFLIEVGVDPKAKPVDLHSDASLLRREALRFEPCIREVLEQMWCWSDVDGNGNIDLEVGVFDVSILLNTEHISLSIPHPTVF